MEKQPYKVRFVLHNVANICCVAHIDTAGSEDPHDEVERQGQSHVPFMGIVAARSFLQSDHPCRSTFFFY